MLKFISSGLGVTLELINVKSLIHSSTRSINFYEIFYLLQREAQTWTREQIVHMTVQVVDSGLDIQVK